MALKTINQGPLSKRPEITKNQTHTLQKRGVKIDTMALTPNGIMAAYRGPELLCSALYSDKLILFLSASLLN